MAIQSARDFAADIEADFANGWANAVPSKITARDDAIRAEERAAMLSEAQNSCRRRQLVSDVLVDLTEYARAQPAERAKETGDE